LIADDHEIVRRGLCALLKSHAEWEVCAEAGDGREAVEKAQQLKPDIVILDIGMPNLNGLIAARQILRIRPDQKILILTSRTKNKLCGKYSKPVRVGSCSSRMPREIWWPRLKRCKQARRSSLRVLGKWFCEHTSIRGEVVRARPDLSSLTSRERGMVQLLAEGKSTKEVAFLLNLGVKSRAAAIEHHAQTSASTPRASWSSMRFGITSSRFTLAHNDEHFALVENRVYIV